MMAMGKLADAGNMPLAIDAAPDDRDRAGLHLWERTIARTDRRSVEVEFGSFLVFESDEWA
jgi:hypothetical protein